MARKHRRCPHCKSKKGFSFTVRLGGTHDFEVSFSGKLIHDKREGTDTIEDYANCLNCDKQIDMEKLDYDNI